MKARFSYFFWLLFIAFSLMILVVATQALTRRNINGLKTGNRDAVLTFTINNRLQDLVNLSFELNTKLAGAVNDPKLRQSLLDSLNTLGYNASVLSGMNADGNIDAAFKRLNDLISVQVETGMRLRQNANAAKDIERLRDMHLSDSIYFTALYIQKELEKDLQETLSNNNKTSDSLSDYNRILSVTVIAAIFIFSAIIINRNFRQIRLITELEIATNAAKKNAQVKDQFLANMSHEIRTPLNAIKGFSRLMSQTPLNNEQQQYSSIIYEATNNLVNIVNDILDISKIEAGKLRIERKDFNIKRVLQAIKHLFKNAAAEKELELSYFIDEGVPEVINGDPERISQVLINLVSNSLKFTTQGYVRIYLGVEMNKNDEISHLRFEILDSGCGIPKDKQDTIFGRFEQLDSTGEKITTGTGLGLSIVKSLVTLMDGAVYVESETGKGATFFVVLPFNKATEGAEEAITLISSEFRPERKYLTSSVLIAEDNRVNQVLIQHMLQEYGIKTEIASNGTEALDFLKSANFDLVFMDVQMPVMDGYTCIKNIRKELRLSVPVVAMTAYALPGEKEKCLSSGMNDYLSKPVDTLELDLILAKYLEENTNSEKGKEIEEREHLLKLAGGDKTMVALIAGEILKEIPDTRKRIVEVLKSEEVSRVSNLSHHMISTFGPLGEGTTIMKKIKEIRLETDRNAEFSVIRKLLMDILSETDSLKGKLGSS